MPRRGEALVALVASDLPDDAALPLVDGAVRQTRSDLEDSFTGQPSRLEDRLGGIY